MIYCAEPFSLQIAMDDRGFCLVRERRQAAAELMSRGVSTRDGAPFRATPSIALPSCSVVLT